MIKYYKGSPYSITERRVPELIPIFGSQPAGDVSHKPSGRLPLLSARPTVTPANLKRTATNFAAWWTEAQWVWTVCLRLLPDNVVTAIWTRVQHANHSAIVYRATPDAEICRLSRLNFVVVSSRSLSFIPTVIGNSSIEVGLLFVIIRLLS